MKRKLLLKALCFSALAAGTIQLSAQELTNQWAFNPTGTGVDRAENITVDGAGNTYVTGSFNGTVNFNPSGPTAAYLISKGGTDIFIVKYATDGSYVWAKSMGGTGDDKGLTVTVDADGNVYVAGSFKATANFNTAGTAVNLIAAGSPTVTATDAFVAKFTSNGTLSWAKRMGSNDATDESAYGVVVDTDKNVYVVGSFRGTADFDGTNSTTTVGSNDIFITKYNENGVIQWVKTIGKNASDIARGIVIDADNNIYVTGVFAATVDFNPGGTEIKNLSATGDNDTFIAKYTSAGAYVWAKKIGGVGADYATGIALDSNKNIYIIGRFAGTANFNTAATPIVNLTSKGGSDIFIAKYTVNGDYLWVNGIGGTSDDYPSNDLSVDSFGNVFIGGQFKGTANFFNVTEDLTESIVANSANFYSGIIVQYDTNGNMKWADKFGGITASDNCAGTARDNNGNLYITGLFNGTNVDFSLSGGTNTKLTTSGSTDIFIAKYKIQESVLPVSLIGFTVKKENNYSRLLWSTASEDNNSHFEVLKSIDGKNWEVATSIRGNNNTNVKIDYSYLDKTPFNGTTYYQLKQVDANGTYSLSDVMSINISLENANELNFWYSDNTLKLFTSSNGNSKAYFTLYDITGRKVISQKIQLTTGTNQLSIPLQLKSGLYTAVLQTDKGIRAAKVLIQE